MQDASVAFRQPTEGQVRKLFLLVIVAAIAGGWAFFQKFELTGIDGVSVKPRGTATAQSQEFVPPPAERRTGTIRIGSFNIQVFGSSKLNNPRAMNVLAEVIRRFDVVAIQEVRAKT